MALLGIDGPAVVLSAETCALLENNRGTPLSALRVRLRGVNQKVATELLELRAAAMAYRQPLPVSAEVEVDSPEVPPECEWLTPRLVADLVGLSDRAVRLACADGRIDARQVGGRWQISPEAAGEFSSARRARKR